MFYWSINAGSLISTILSPTLRRLDCGKLGTEDQCFFLPFVIPTCLMAIAILFFVIGTKYYTRVPPSGNNIFWDCLKCLFFGMFRKIPEEAKEKGFDHWLYGAYGKVPNWLIRDTKYLVRVLVMFSPLPIFWAAYDQQGSKWTLQVIRLNGWVSGSAFITADQTHILNPALILIFIPLFGLVYDWIDKCFGKGTVTRLRKLTFGIFLASTTYVMAGILQSQIDKTLTITPQVHSEISFNVVNLRDVDNVTGRIYGNYRKDLNLNDITAPFANQSYVKNTKTLETIVKYVDGERFSFETDKEIFDLGMAKGRSILSLAILPDDRYFTYQGWVSKHTDGEAHIVLINALDIL